MRNEWFLCLYMGENLFIHPSIHPSDNLLVSLNIAMRFLTCTIKETSDHFWARFSPLERTFHHQREGSCGGSGGYGSRV